MYLRIRKKDIEGERKRSLLLFKNFWIGMKAGATQEIISGFLDNYLSDSPDIFLINIKISPANDIRTFLDGDNGITIQKCSEINKALYKFIEEKQIFEGNNFSLEVSSPGIGEPLKLYRQYVKNIGRNVEIELNDGSKISGKLLTVSDDELTIEEKTGKGNKSTTKSVTIFFNQIKQTIVLITF